MSKRGSKVVYPCVRHFQRYEYIVNMGYVSGKNVVEVGDG